MPWNGPQNIDQWKAWARKQTTPQKNQHVAWATTGERGAGKTDLNLILGVELQAPVPFKPAEQVVLRPKDRVHVARRLGKRRVILDDESSGEGGNKRRSMGQANVDNIMDLDVMRGRNQYTGFTAPEFDSLDSGIQEAVDWIFVVTHDHVLTAYTMEHRGKPGNRFHYPKERFVMEGVPSCKELYPEVRTEYDGHKDRFLSGSDDQNAHKHRGWEDKAERVVRGVLANRGLLKPVKATDEPVLGLKPGAGL